MINDGGLSFETQLEIEFFHQIMVVEKGLEKFLHSKINKKMVSLELLFDMYKLFWQPKIIC